jgi:putative glycerol-1-phosphate prenyltransferase
MSNTTPIPSDKSDIAASTAMAGEMLGMKLIYLDAGSGAGRPVPEEMILHVKKSIGIPLILGGGIRCAASARNAWSAGADIVVVGNALEKDPEFIEQLCKERNRINRVRV